MHKAFPLLVMKFPLPEDVPTASEESSHCQKKGDATTVKIALLLKLRSNCQSKTQSQEFRDSYEVPGDAVTTGSDGTGKKKGMTVTLTTDDMKKRKNDTAILKTFGGNEATKKTKKNLLKQQYGKFKAEGLETLEQTFNRLQIDKDDIEEMDIKWNMALLSIKADRFWKNTEKKITIQGSNVAGFDKSKSYMENDEENHALVTDEEAPTEFALMAKTSAESEVFDNSLCSKACKKNTDSLNSKITELTDKLSDAKNMIYHYKLALAQVEARLAEHRNQEVKYCKKIKVLEFKTESRANCIESFTKKLKLIKKEKEGLESKLTGFQSASKDLDSLLESQRLDKNKDGLGYSAVPPPPAQVYSLPEKDLSWT
uniref:Uncharacterized protein n=1 Tax=Tanacetum cinerariifolium TaxID=118510 RepID=A0A6L2M2L7_TANCI|nr:hypothetical protein [Tanacetum cinerariifolium]